MDEPAYRVVNRLAKAIQRALGWQISVDGGEHIPEEGPAIIAANHAGYCDFIFAAWSPVFDSNRYVRFLAKKEVFDNWFTGPIMRAMKHIPVDRTGDRKAAIQIAIQALESGELIGGFPEGSVNRSFVPIRGKTGIVRMAQATGAPVIPAAVWGAHRIVSKGQRPRISRGLTISVAYAAPMYFAADEDPRKATDRLMPQISNLLEGVQARYPQRPSSLKDSWWLPQHLGGTAPAPEQVKPRDGKAGLA